MPYTYCTLRAASSSFWHRGNYARGPAVRPAPFGGGAQVSQTQPSANFASFIAAAAGAYHPQFGGYRQQGPVASLNWSFRSVIRCGRVRQRRFCARLWLPHIVKQLKGMSPPNVVWIKGEDALDCRVIDAFRCLTRSLGPAAGDPADPPRPPESQNAKPMIASCTTCNR